MKREYMPRMVPFAKARELFVRVKNAGMKIVLATSAKADDLAFYKRLVGMEDLVDEEATSSDAQEWKPQPDIFAGALKEGRKRSGRSNSPGRYTIRRGSSGEARHSDDRPHLRRLEGPRSLSAGCIEVFRDPEHLLSEFDRSALVGKNCILLSLTSIFDGIARWREQVLLREVCREPVLGYRVEQATLIPKEPVENRGLNSRSLRDRPRCDRVPTFAYRRQLTDNDSAVDLGLNLGDFHFTLKAANYMSSDSPARILAFYRKPLPRYGGVLECDHGKAVVRTL